MVVAVSKAVRMIHKPVAISSLDTNRTRAFFFFVTFCDLRQSEAKPATLAPTCGRSHTSLKFEQINSIRLSGTRIPRRELF